MFFFFKPLVNNFFETDSTLRRVALLFSLNVNTAYTYFGAECVSGNLCLLGA